MPATVVGEHQLADVGRWPQATITEVLHIPTGLPRLVEEKTSSGIVIRRLTALGITFGE